MVVEEDFQLQDEDYEVEVDDGVPSVKFSNCVHGFIGRRMGNCLVIKLMDRSISFTALLNRIQLLWKPSHPFQLMDLDNNFYLVRFEDRHYMKRWLRVVLGFFLATTSLSNYGLPLSSQIVMFLIVKWSRLGCLLC